MAFKSRLKNMAATLSFIFGAYAIASMDDSAVKAPEAERVKNYLDSKGCDTSNLKRGEIPFCPDEPSHK